MVDFADYPVESQSFPRGQKAIFEAKGRSMESLERGGKGLGCFVIFGTNFGTKSDSTAKKARHKGALSYII